jgi:UDP-N-acetylglucosamine 2-epimerase (non-hydrolysing)
MKIISVVGARPNFVKIAPFICAINNYNELNLTTDLCITSILVHTGQHYDERMSKQYFTGLDIPEVDINLGIGSGSHAEQVGKTMIEFEKILRREKPDWVVVVGDVNATLACSITAKKENIKCCHIEAGLRSGDMNMPEEINRLVTDRLSDLLLTPDRISSENLRKEGVPEQKICFVGNIMVDTLEANRRKASTISLKDILKRNALGNRYHLDELRDEQYALLTIHRPSNVDNQEVLTRLVHFLTQKLTNDMPLLWPLHPRTQKQLEIFDLWQEVESTKNLILLHPLDYNDMLRLNMAAKVVLTDSGGLQEECTILGTPCFTLRGNTERPITLMENGGSSILIGNKIELIQLEYRKIYNKPRTPFRPELWDGKTAERCLEAILKCQNL